MASLRSCLKFLAILKRLNFQEPVSGFCLPIGGYFGSFLRFSRPIAWLSSFEKRRKIPRNFLPMPQTNKFKQLLKKRLFVVRALCFRAGIPVPFFRNPGLYILGSQSRNPAVPQSLASLRFFRFGAFPKVFRFVNMDFIFVKMEEKVAVGQRERKS